MMQMKPLFVSRTRAPSSFDLLDSTPSTQPSVRATLRIESMTGSYSTQVSYISRTPQQKKGKVAGWKS